MSQTAIKFLLSGRDYTGEMAQRMFDSVREHGFDQVEGSLHPWPIQHRHLDLQRFYAYAQVSGVSASVEVTFESAEEVIDFMRGARLNEPDSAAATAAYRRLIDIERGTE